MTTSRYSRSGVTGRHGVVRVATSIATATLGPPPPPVQVRLQAGLARKIARPRQERIEQR